MAHSPLATASFFFGSGYATVRLMRRALVLAVITSAASASAIGFQVDAAGGYWLAGSPQFQARLGVQQQLSELSRRTHLVVAMRTGVFVNTAGSRLGIPVDVAFELHVGPVLFGVVGGPWFHFNDGDVLRAHIGGEFGVLLSRMFRLSFEVSWLQPSPLLLGRFGVVF